MKKLTASLLFGWFLLSATALFSQEPNLDELLSKHYQAIGMEKLHRVSSVIQTGTLIQQDAMPVTITRVRPDKFLMVFDIQDITAYQGYDGKGAWMTAPWTGNPKPQAMPEERARDLRVRADIDGLLYDWKAKGHKVEMAGRDTVDGLMAWKLKVTRSDGGTEYLSLGDQTNLVVKRLYHRNIRGQETPFEIFFRDYRPVEGIMFPFEQETRIGGKPYNSVQFDEVVLNRGVDPKIFSMP